MLNKIEKILSMRPTISVSAITAICVLMSVVITLPTFIVFGKEIHGVVVLAAITAPLIIAPLVSSLMIKLVLEKESQKKKIYKNSASEARNILREFLHDVEYFESEAERIGGFDGNTMRNLEGALKKIHNRLDALENVGDLTTENKILD